MSVTLIDLGYGNLGSIQAAFRRLGAEAEASCDPHRIAMSERLVLPGVGSAGFAMDRLKILNLEPVIREFKKPFLGICLGMHLLFDSSEEDECRCLGLIKGRIKRLTAAPGRPVPHMGWSRLEASHTLLGIATGDYAWFAHSFAAAIEPYCIAQASYGVPIAAAVQLQNFTGCQFHPERSASPGARFLKAFLEQ